MIPNKHEMNVIIGTSGKWSYEWWEFQGEGNGWQLIVQTGGFDKKQDATNKGYRYYFDHIMDAK